MSGVGRAVAALGLAGLAAGVDSPADPTYVRADISWSTDPDDWERARADLAAIILAAPPAR